jgi:hypothetical protein
MLVSTKLDTIVQFLARRQRPTAERLATGKPPERGVAGFCVAALFFHQANQLAAEQRRDGQAFAGRDDA